MPQEKGKVCYVGTTEDPLLLKMANKFRSKDAVARKPESPSNDLVPIALPNSINVNSSLDFILAPEHVIRHYELVSNLESLGQQIKTIKYRNYRLP